MSSPASIAHACSIDPCQPSATLPMDGASLPANVPGFLWRRPPDLDSAVDPDYQLELQALGPDGAITTLEIETVERNRLLQIRPLVEISADTELAFSYLQPGCGRLANERVTVWIRVTEPMPAPESLGSLTATEGTGTIQVASVAGDCDRQIVAGYADVSLRLSDAARPYADVLRYELRVDGKVPWRFYDVVYAGSIEQRIGASSLGPGRDRLYTPCSDAARLRAALPELAQGKHRVRMIGILPDDTQLVSEEIEVDLRCDGEDTGAGLPNPPMNTERPVLSSGAMGCSVAAAPSGSGRGRGRGVGFLGSAALLLTAAIRMGSRRRRPRSEV